MLPKFAMARAELGQAAQCPPAMSFWEFDALYAGCTATRVACRTS